jgi:hypothetical protein
MNPGDMVRGEKQGLSKTLIIVVGSVLIIAMAVTLEGVYSVSAQTEVEGNATRQMISFPLLKRSLPLMLRLSEEPRAEIQDTIQSMKEQGATPNEIREYIQDFLVEKGVQVKPPMDKPELSEEQLALFKQLQEDAKVFTQERAAELGLNITGDGFSLCPWMNFHGPMGSPGFHVWFGD